MQRPVAGQKRCQTLFILPRKKVADFHRLGGVCEIDPQATDSMTLLLAEKATLAPKGVLPFWILASLLQGRANI